MRADVAGRIAMDVCRQCADRFGGKVRDVYLYGSYARGDYDDQSDVDILFTVCEEADGLAPYRHAASVISSDLSLKYDVTVQIAVKAASAFDRYARFVPYYSNVAKEGIRFAV